jgi:hypothetical protein
MPKIIGENIDHLCNIEYRPGKGSARGDTMKYYEAARKVQEEPLSYLCASAMIERIKPGDKVLLVTGSRFPHMLPYGETDGPLGAVALAKALEKGLGAKCIVTVEESNKAPTLGCLMGAGCNMRELEDFEGTDGACYLDFYPLGSEEGPVHAKYLIETFKPKAIVFCEKHGPNECGYCHSVLGARIPPEEFANTWYLLDEAKKHGILTIGAGDGGNEIGNGVIYEAARDISPYGRKCQCGCGGGTATVCKTDIFFAAAISNWALYGMAAMLAYMMKDVNIMHDIDTERRMLEACAAGGSVDGMAMRPIPRVDGVSMAGGQAFVTLLREIVTNGLTENHRTK